MRTKFLVLSAAVVALSVGSGAVAVAEATTPATSKCQPPSCIYKGPPTFPTITDVVYVHRLGPKGRPIAGGDANVHLKKCLKRQTGTQLFVPPCLREIDLGTPTNTTTQIQRAIGVRQYTWSRIIPGKDLYLTDIRGNEFHWFDTSKTGPYRYTRDDS